MRTALKDQAAIVGIGATEFSKNSGRSELQLAAESVRNALEDCGLKPSDVDGMTTFTLDTSDDIEVARAVGIGALKVFSRVPHGGGAATGLLHQAAMAIATADGISHIPPVLLRAAQTLGATRRSMSTRVVLPAALPSIVTGIKLGWTLGWHGVVSAELIKSSVGLGFLLHAGRELNDAAQVIGVMLVTVFIGLILDRLLFAAVEKRVRSRWGFAPAAARA